MVDQKDGKVEAKKYGERLCMKYIDLFAGVGGFRYGLEKVRQHLQVGRTSRDDIRQNRVKSDTNTSQKGRKSGNAFSCVWSSKLEKVRVSGNRSSRSVHGRGKKSLQPQGEKPSIKETPLLVSYSNEWDKYANSVYRYHYKECDQRDIRAVKADEIPKHDLLCGGFPCQSFSVAGKRGGFEDTRGTLFFEIARILRDKRPRYLLLENVKGLLSHDKGKTFQTIIGVLSDIGYGVQWQVLNSKDFGVPQNRERVFIIGHSRKVSRPEVFPIRQTNPKSLNYVGAIMSKQNKQWLKDGKKLSRNFPQGQRVYNSSGIGATMASNAGGLGAKTGLYMVDDPSRKKGIIDKNIAPTLRKESHGNLPAVVMPVLTPNRLKKRQHGRRFKTDGEPSFTLTGRDIHGVAIQNPLKGKTKYGWHFEQNVYGKTGISRAVKSSSGSGNKLKVLSDMSIRRLTPIECERLQGFPDNWTKVGVDGEISDTQRYKMCGNAVTTSVIAVIGERLLKAIDK